MITNHNERLVNGRYDLVQLIGVGALAEVFLAHDRREDRDVAVKILRSRLATDPTVIARFRRESNAIARLDHPRIVESFDFGPTGSTYYLAMEFVDGPTLAQVLADEGPLASVQAATIADEVADALGAAHAAGIVHRDIKPANIMLTTQAGVKVVDFGIARIYDSPDEPELTQVGTLMGTASYASPEQAQGAPPDPRGDLYSLGAVMFEMVAGRPPFEGATPFSVAYKQVHDDPKPLRKVVPGIPRAYESIVDKLLAKDPDRRFQSAAALRVDLGRLLDSHDAPGSPALNTMRRLRDRLRVNPDA